MRPQKLIIGCGYLGRRVAARWVAAGDAVFALTRSTVNADEIRAIGVVPIVGDVMDPSSLASLPIIDTVLYAVGLDRRAGHSQREVYVDGLANVLSGLRLQTSRSQAPTPALPANGEGADLPPFAGGLRSGAVPCALERNAEQVPLSPQKFIYISSTSVYGQNAGEWVDESSECRPDAPNGQVCLEAEQLLRRELPTAMILRLAGIYGPGRLVARVEQLRAGAPLAGNPEAWLNLIHVDDAASTVLACEKIGEPGSTTLVSDDRPHCRREYYTLLASLIGAPVPQFDESQLDAAARSRLNKRCCNRRLREVLRVELRYPTIVEGLRDVVTE